MAVPVVDQLTYSPTSSQIFSEGQALDHLSSKNLSLRERYQIRKEKIQQLFESESWQVPTRQASSLPKDIWNLLALEPENFLEPIEAATIVSAPLALGSVKQLHGIELREVSSSGLPILAACAVATVGLAFIGGAYLYTTRYSSYANFEKEIRERTGELLNLLRDPLCSLAALSNQVNGLLQKRSESSLERLFDLRNPNEMYQLLIARGIVFDSEGNHEEAQQIYQSALSFRTWIYGENDHTLRDLLHYLYARSLRFSGKGNLALAQIDQIPETSPVHSLGRIERTALQNLQEAFDDEEEELPFALCCHISCQVMEEPMYYVHNGHIHYYDRIPVQDWLSRNPREPECGTSLYFNYLTPDPQMGHTINLWKLTRFKR